MDKIWRFYLQPLQRNLRECKILKMDHMTCATRFSGMINHPKANIWHSIQNLTTLQPFHRYFGGVKLYNASRDPDHAPFQGRFVIYMVGYAIINLPPRLKCLTLPITEIWKALQTVENGLWGGLKWLGITGNVTIRLSAYNFLFVFNRNYTSIVYRLCDIAFDKSSIALFCYPCCV